MDELNDYSGEFNPKIKLEDFSKDVLVKLMELYNRLYMRIDGFWYLSVMQRVNEDTATDCDLWVWEKQAKYEIERIADLLNVERNSIAGFFKYLQFAPWFWNLGCEIEVNNGNSGILTVFRCPTLESMERESRGRDKTFCEVVETKMFDILAKRFNPNINFKHLNLPPRQSKDDVCCRWEFVLGTKVV